MEIIDGELWVYYTDGTEQNLGSISTGEAAADDKRLIYVLLPNNTYSVGIDSAYKDSVESIEIPEIHNGITITEIKSGGFKECKSLKSIKLPNTLISIGSSAFEGCTSLNEVYVPDSVNSMSETIFKNCTSLTSVHLPETMTKIPAYTFEGCVSLTSFTISKQIT